MPQYTGGGSLAELHGGEDTNEVVKDIERRTSDDRPSREALLEALSNRRRRYTLHYLQKYEGTDPVELSDISRQVAAWEKGVEVGAINYGDRKNVHTSLYQFHAPKLDEIRLVNYDKRRSTLQLTEYGENVQLTLDVTAGGAAKPRYMPVLSGLSVAVVAGAWLDVPLIGAVPDIVYAAVIAGTFVVSSILVMQSDDHEQVVSEHPPEPIEK